MRSGPARVGLARMVGAVRGRRPPDSGRDRADRRRLAGLDRHCRALGGPAIYRRLARRLVGCPSRPWSHSSSSWPSSRGPHDPSDRCRRKKCGRRDPGEPRRCSPGRGPATQGGRRDRRRRTVLAWAQTGSALRLERGANAPRVEEQARAALDGSFWTMLGLPPQPIDLTLTYATVLAPSETIN